MGLLTILLRTALASISLSVSEVAGQLVEEGEQRLGACQCSAVDYADAGSYLVNAGADGRFTYASRFEGECGDGDITSVLRDPDGRLYECSPMRPGTPGSIQLSECDIAYEEMKTGTWQIVINLESTEVKRTFTLTVGAPETVVTTITPTVIIGTTSTPPASTVIATTYETTTVTLRPTTITTPCTAPRTTRSTTRGPPTLVTSTHVIVIITTDLTVTTSATTTSALLASCRYPTSSSSVRSTSTSRGVSSTSTTRSTSTTPSRPTTITITAAPSSAAAGDGYTFTMSGSTCVVDWASAQAGGAAGGWGPPWQRGGGGWGKGKGKWGGGGGNGRGGPPDWVTSMWQGGLPPWITAGGTLPPWVSCARTTATRPRRAAAVSAAAREVERRGRGKSMAAWTSTVLQTTFTETRVTTSILPAETVTRFVIGTAIQTITPAPSTQCVIAPDVTEIVTASGPLLTQVTLVTSTSHVTATVFVTMTVLTISNDMAAATSCWQNGGNYGVNQP